MTTTYFSGKVLRQPHRDVVSFTVFALFAAYLFFLVKLFFLQIEFHWASVHIVTNRHAADPQLPAMTNVVPFYKILYYARGCEPYAVGLLNVMGNIVIFLPMGLALPYFFNGLQSGGRLWRVVAFISLAVEVLQLVTATGVFDVDDVLLNTAGALVGCWFFTRLRKAMPIAAAHN